MVYGRSVTVQRHRHSENLKVLPTHQLTGAEDAHAFFKRNCGFKNTNPTVEQILDEIHLVK